MILKGLYHKLNKPRMLAFFIGIFLCMAGAGEHSMLRAEPVITQPSAEIPAQPVFRTLQWKARVIVITGDYQDTLADEQLTLLRSRLSDLQQRDVAVLRFARDDIDELEEFSQFAYAGWYEMDAHEQRFMESQLQADNNVFSVVLVGKDGGVQRVWTPLPEAPQTIPVAEILNEIDQMPMRSNELQSQGRR